MAKRYLDVNQLEFHLNALYDKVEFLERAICGKVPMTIIETPADSGGDVIVNYTNERDPQIIYASVESVIADGNRVTFIDATENSIEYILDPILMAKKTVTAYGLADNNGLNTISIRAKTGVIKTQFGDDVEVMTIQVREFKNFYSNGINIYLL